MKTENIADREADDRYAEKMARKKAIRDRIMRSKTVEKGLLIVYTGTGKGKSTAAFGMVMRALGHGLRVGVVQFVKGRWITGERSVLEQFPDLCRVEVMGEGFSWETQDLQRDAHAARSAWAVACKMIQDPDYHLILLDELHIVMRQNHLQHDEVMTMFAHRRPSRTHIITTGRNAPPELIEAADLVTEMRSLKHPFRAGMKAQPGIEY